VDSAACATLQRNYTKLAAKRYTSPVCPLAFYCRKEDRPTCQFVDALESVKRVILLQAELFICPNFT
jgi:hypothetical protein